MRKKVILMITMIVMSIWGYAQLKEITARITDSAGNPIPNASIKVKGSKTGMFAGADGVFNIRVPAGSVLQISAINFQTREIRAGDASGDIRLINSNEALKEVVVTALNITREKRSLGYATQSVGSEQLNKSGTGNPLSELNGKASGVTVINSSGDPGAGTYIRLSGVTSITGTNQLLLLIVG